MGYYSIYFDSASNTAHSVNCTRLFPFSFLDGNFGFLDGNTAHGANYSRLFIFSFLDSNTAYGVNYIGLFRFLDSNTAHGVNYTKLFSTIDSNAVLVIVAGCRFRAVFSCPL